jgi:hypothetical protein
MTALPLLISVTCWAPAPGETPAFLRQEHASCATLAEAVNHHATLGEEAALKNSNPWRRLMIGPAAIQPTRSASYAASFFSRKARSL